MEKIRKERTKEKGSGMEKAGLIAVCLAMSVIVFLVLLSMERNMLAEYEKQAAVMVKRYIPSQTLITEDNADDYFEIRELEKAAVPDKGFHSLEELYGHIPLVSLDKGIIPTASLVGSREEILGTMQRPVMAGISAEDIYQVVGGILRKGDTINIYTVDQETKEALPVWKNVCIAQVFDSSGNEIPNDDTESIAQRLNIYMDEENIEQFYTELASGSLRVVKICD